MILGGFGRLWSALVGFGRLWLADCPRKKKRRRTTTQNKYPTAHATRELANHAARLVWTSLLHQGGFSPVHNKRGAADFTTQRQTGRNGPFILAHFRKHEQRDAACGVARRCNEARPLKSRARANTRRTAQSAPPARLRWKHPPKCRPAARSEPSRDLTTMICTRSVRGKTAWRASIRIGRSHRPLASAARTRRRSERR